MGRKESLNFLHPKVSPNCWNKNATMPLKLFFQVSLRLTSVVKCRWLGSYYIIKMFSLAIGFYCGLVLWESYKSAPPTNRVSYKPPSSSVLTKTIAQIGKTAVCIALANKSVEIIFITLCCLLICQLHPSF